MIALLLSLLLGQPRAATGSNDMRGQRPHGQRWRNATDGIHGQYPHGHRRRNATGYGHRRPHRFTTKASPPSPPVVRPGEIDFRAIAHETGTDKVDANYKLATCLKNDRSCTRPSCANPRCRPWGHFYDTMYQNRLGSFSRVDTPKFQFLEIGYYNGRGFDAFRNYFPNAELHSMEIACIARGPRKEGKWPYGNFAAKNPRYQSDIDAHRLHCGDANDVNFLHSIWTKEMQRPDAPPLKVVVDDAAHLSGHMAQSVFFWFPRIEPRGLLVVEDIQPTQDSDKFRTQFLPQIMADLHYCGDPKQKPDAPCFPTLQPLLASIHCELHICVFERNDEPAVELSLEDSTSPPNALKLNQCKSFQ